MQHLKYILYTSLLTQPILFSLSLFCHLLPSLPTLFFLISTFALFSLYSPLLHSTYSSLFIFILSLYLIFLIYLYHSFLFLYYIRSLFLCVSIHCSLDIFLMRYFKFIYLWFLFIYVIESCLL